MKKIILLHIILLFSLSALADSIGNKIDNLISATDANINIGIKITNLEANNIIYDKNIDRYFTFASGLKLITLTTLLEELGADYKFNSSIFTNNNEYYLEIHDPTYSIEDLELLIFSLKSKNINSIDGNFYIINEEFKLPPLMRSKTVSDTLYCNSSPITRVHINQNCSKTIISPQQIGQKVQVSTTELMPYEIINEAITTADNNLELIYTGIKDNKYIISGTLNESGNPLTIGAVTNDNLKHVSLILEYLLKKHDIKLDGKILIADEKPNEAKLIAVKNNDYLQVATLAMKKSNNFITDYLLAESCSNNKKLLAEIAPRQMEWHDAGNFLKELVNIRLGVDIKDSVIEDGSGISRINLLTVAQFDRILISLSKKPNFSEILSMLTKPGEEGTLKNRFSEKAKIHAKTGSLLGVTSIVGYFYDKHDVLHSFVIVINNIYGDKNKYIKLQEDIINLFLVK